MRFNTLPKGRRRGGQRGCALAEEMKRHISEGRARLRDRPSSALQAPEIDATPSQCPALRRGAAVPSAGDGGTELSTGART